MNLESRIHQVLAGLGPMTVDQISIALSCEPRSARRQLSLLVESGQVKASVPERDRGAGFGRPARVYEVVA